uniref:Uncharacterized protein n=2 Tax=Oryza TaxID=4527 RepID=Q10MP0_ORYSJ|nr:hypothetical protein LOC_Os03g18930 [Oryza sativa Japonica Group]
MEERMAAGEAKTVATDTERKPTRTAPTVRRTTSAEEKTPPSVYRDENETERQIEGPKVNLFLWVDAEFISFRL